MGKAQLSLRGNVRGNVILATLIYSVIGVIFTSLLISVLLRKNKSQLDFRMFEKKASVLESVLSRATNELREALNDSTTCTLNQLTAPTSQIFNQVKPKIYGKGEFVLDEKDEKGALTGRFYAPESDPKVWIEAEAASSPGVYKIDIETTVCKQWIPGRNKFPPDDTGLGKPWSPACPSDMIQTIKYSGFFDTSSFISYYTVYYDRSLLGNTSLDEPVTESAVDAEEKIAHDIENSSIRAGDEASEEVSGKPYRFTGPTHDPTDRDDRSERSQTIIFEALDYIQKTDSCAEVAVYSVAGRGASPADQIRPHYTDTSKPIPQRFFRKMKTEMNSIRNGMIDACKKHRPAGTFTAKGILDHFIGYHQPASVSEAERGRKRALMIMSDGWDLLGQLPTPGDAVQKLRRADVYFTDFDCLGTGVVERSSGPSSADLADFVGTTVLAGEKLYQPASSLSALPLSNVLPSITPPLEPMPSGTFHVRSVINSLDGSCINILAPDTKQYVAYQYRYYLYKPWVVSRRLTEPTVVSEVMSTYQPVQDIVKEFNARAETGLVRDYENTLILFPIPATDLDEAKIINTGKSERKFVLKDLKLDIVPAYLSFFKWLEDKPWKDGIKVFELID